MLGRSLFCGTIGLSFKKVNLFCFVFVSVFSFHFGHFGSETGLASGIANCNFYSTLCFQLLIAFRRSLLSKHCPYTRRISDYITDPSLFQDFGSIFSTLLPGTTAKLAPPEGQTELDGLEVKVAFGNVWKESLSELSGGQRYVYFLRKANQPLHVL